MDIIEYHFVPWGNAYYDSPLLASCPGNFGTYSRERFPCWAELCNTTQAPDECFNGTKLCQHTDTECSADSLEACAIHLYASSPKLYSSFIYCLEGLHGYYSQGVGGVNMSFFKSCANQAGVDPLWVSQCSNDPVTVDILDKQAARETASAAGIVAQEWGTPWVIIDGVHLDDVSSLLTSVCTAWASKGGTPPDGCKEQLS